MVSGTRSTTVPVIRCLPSHSERTVCSSSYYCSHIYMMCFFATHLLLLHMYTYLHDDFLRRNMFHWIKKNLTTFVILYFLILRKLSWIEMLNPIIRYQFNFSSNVLASTCRHIVTTAPKFIYCLNVCVATFNISKFFFSVHSWSVSQRACEGAISHIKRIILVYVAAY